MVLTVTGSKQFVESNGQHVDGERVIQLAAQIEAAARTHHGAVVTQVVDTTQQLPHHYDIVQGNRHASASQRVPHVERVAKAHDATTVDRRRSEKIVGHAANLAARHCL